MSKQFDPFGTTAPELHLPFNNLVVSGCSFTAGSSDIEKARSVPTVWSHFLLQKYRCTRYANLAIPSGGNFAAGCNLIYYLETHYCDPQDTLVVYNITEFDRIDTATVNHPNSNPYFSWSQDLGIEWITQGSFLANKAPFHGMLQKHIGYETTVLINVLQSLLLHEYLCSRGYTYRWMYMSDRCSQQIPDNLKSSVNRHESSKINFDSFDSMHEYVASMAMTISQDDPHPSVEGHAKIADKIIENLGKKHD